MWNAVAPIDVDGPAPSSRSKHSATLVGEHVYLLGGRNGNLPMKDFWRYNLVSGKWQQLKPSGDKLPCLQEHSAVAYKDTIYVFGGEVSFSGATETPLWQYDIRNNNWRKVRSKKGVVTPKGRRGHTALIYKNSMLVYGGYQDLKGSCNELWAFHFDTESWHLLSNASLKSNSDNCPSPRHKHSAVIHDDCMWVYGGMTDLQERSDLWKYDITSKAWHFIKTKINPGLLHSHAACRLPSSMLIFGGERNGHPSNELWKFNFSFESWEKITISGTKPQPRSEAVSFAVSELLLQSQNSASLESKSLRIRTRTCNSADRGNRHSSYLPNNKVVPCEKTYVFQPTQNNYNDGSNLAHQYSEKVSRSFLQEISKLSQMNITRLNNKCNYTVLTGTNTDSTESLLRQHSSPHCDTEYIVETDFSTPVKGTMIKSKSAYVIKKRYQTDDENKDPTKKRVEFDNANMNKLSREPISVPNFSTLVLPTPVLTPVEATKLVYLTDDEEVPHNSSTNEDNDSHEYENFQSSVNRENSYSSHLAYADNPVYQHMMNSSHIEENVSSTSDYASIETMNRLSSASNYSVKTNTPQDENAKNREKDKISDGPFGFCNPNYLGPDIKSVLKNGDKKEVGKALNQIELKSSHENLLELQNYTKVYYRHSRPTRCLNLTTNEVKSRAHSANRAEKHKSEPKNESHVALYIFIIGGKEQGQVTVFQRPISIWKLKLF